MTSLRHSHPPRNTCTASSYASSLTYITHTIPRFSTFARSPTSTHCSPIFYLSERSTSCWISRRLRDSQALQSGLVHYGNAGRRWGSLILLLNRDVQPPYHDGPFVSTWWITGYQGWFGSSFLSYIGRRYELMMYESNISSNLLLPNLSWMPEVFTFPGSRTDTPNERTHNLK